MKLYNLGSLNIDYVYAVSHFVTAGETLASESMQVFPGGKGLNQSVAAARAGAKVVHGALMGEGGDFLLDAMLSSGVDISRIQKVGGSCGHAIIQVENGGQNGILLFPGTNHRIDESYVEAFLADAEPNDILLLQNEISGLDAAFSLAHEKGMQIAFNPSPFHPSLRQLPLSHVTWWFCNEIEGEALFGSSDPEQIAANFAKLYPESSLILTLGENGSLFKNRDTLIRQDACPAKAVDTTAAGDTFTGYFMAAVMSGQATTAALAIASKASAITVSRPGASESIPFLHEVDHV